MNALPVSTVEGASPVPLSAVVAKAALVAALGGLLFGFDSAVTSGTTDALQTVFDLNNFWLGFTISSAMAGTVIGSMVAGPLANLHGRKKILFVLAITYLISSIGCGLAQSWWFFLTARFLGGLAIGGSSVVAPLYIAEIAPPVWRGRLVGLNQLNVVVGILLSFVSNYAIASWLDSETAWRWMLGVVAVPSLVFFLLVFTISESPRWLASKGKFDEARLVLRQIGIADVEGELSAIRTSLADGANAGQDRLFQARYGRMIFLAWAVAMFNQLSGINALVYYTPKIFQMAGASRDSALLQSVALWGTNLVFTVSAMFMIDRFGRRPLLLVGSVGTAACLGLVAVQMAKGDQANGTVLLAALLGFIAFFAFSQGAVIWVFISEVFPNAVRAKGQALGSFTHWFMAAAISWSFPVVAAASGAAAFAFFAAMMGLQFLFAWFIMPETKGGTLEQIEQRFGRESAKETKVA
ncbi:sugar porter family MFS transporter [Zavarzinella formosa]|uniref:sugar porter family MFS transporter n=1 Tax=Zavarzinella formosa TaxID=360055 RepID=UPI0002D93828|nr:sugar porter family MFS transporter [Zavarzinella formosa]